MRVLVVDDSRHSRLMVKTFLEGMGLPIEVIEEADNGETAVSKYKLGAFDLVLMDIQMPNMDGYEATALIRKWETKASKPRTPIIALTAMDTDQDAEKLKLAGFTAHCPKPVKKAALGHAIKAVTSCGPVEEPPAPEPPKETGGLLKRLFGDKNKNKMDTAGLEQVSHPDMRASFIVEKQREIGEALLALDSGDLKTIEVLAYRLKGEGANYGFAKVTEFGAALTHAVDVVDTRTVRMVAQQLMDYLLEQEP